MKFLYWSKMAKNSLLFEKLMKHNVKHIIKGLQSYIKKTHKGTELLKRKRNVHYQMAKQKAQHMKRINELITNVKFLAW